MPSTNGMTTVKLVRLHVLCFTEIPDGIRVISFRKANAREVKRYAKAKTAD